ncbi:fungal-specific transcription factor domain-containing protein [Crucibulum laeve]|uniref:Fungal-specific transcription factor domain-containing protein n=1 Tax=Crucibulum laeve TaxID=68775 RepID=A0A5C3LXG2_9AGAR|nr:fungal-specific transcription factor domain-containing protein [Crucibulum laeve]
MPVDTTRIIPTRRTQRQITEEELKDIEIKRLRGELSCAECRRLKLRCDKKVPCGSCCRRGCESICPCGILSAGQGTRFILADTEQLHRKISDMSNRIRQLEDALAILQSTVSDQRHPLLEDELLKVKFGSEALDARAQQSSSSEEETTKGSIDAFGTLTLGESGYTKYYGRSAGSETLMMAGEESEPALEDDSDEEGEERVPLPPELDNLANLFPYTSKNRPNNNTLEQLESLLPTHDRAWALCNSYLDHASLFFRPFKREELFNIFLPGVYNTASARVEARVAADASPGNDHEDGSIDEKTPHLLAGIFFLFALGALLDLNLPPYNAEAEYYYDLGRAALSLRAVFETPTLESVRALGLMATYHSLAGKKYSRDSAWCIMSFAAKLAQSIGLHRDPTRWNMDATVVQRRRNLFWEVFAADVSHSLALGRPPTIHLSYVDCEFPLDEEASLSDSGETQSGFWHMKHTFGRDIFNSVVEATLTAKSPSYNTVLDLDRKVREISFPANFKPYVLREEGEAEFFSSSLSLRGFYASQHRTVTMLYLHRSFFAQAMLDHPMNPLLSPYSPSFLTAYRCASVIIKASAHQFERCAEMAMRVWFLMYHTFSAAVIVGTVVTRSPNSNIASSALLDLNLAVDLFERTALQSQRAKVALGVLRKLREKAIRAYTQFCSATLPSQVNSDGSTSNPTSFGIFSAQATDDVEDELAIFGGHTRVIDKKPRSKYSGSSGMSDSSHGSGSVSPSSEHVDIKPTISAAMDTMPEVHPSLVEYLSQDAVRRAHVPASPIQPNNMTGGNQQYPQDYSSSNSQQQPNNRKQLGEMYSNFMGYLASRTVPSAPVTPPSPAVQNSYGVVPQYASSSSSLQYAPSPQNDNTNQSSAPPFNWSSPSLVTPTNHPASSQITSLPESYSTLSNFSTPQVLSSSLPMQDPYNGFTNSYFSGRSTSTFGTPQSTNNSGAIVEIGLSTDSGMDAKWLSFMRECGIMEGRRTN